MDPRTFPTKGNLMLAKNSLALAKQGYDLMDRKRNILIRELMGLVDQARRFRKRSALRSRTRTAPPARQYRARHQLWASGHTVPIEDTIAVKT